jgi:hypothetical protein
MNYSVYSTVTGEIKKQVSCPSLLINHQLGPEQAFIPGLFSDITYYIKNEEAVTRPTQTTTLSNTSVLANEIDAVVLQHLPIPCTVTVANAVYEVDDGTLEISFDTPGEYQVTVTSFPYLDKTFTVEAI